MKPFNVAFFPVAPNPITKIIGFSTVAEFLDLVVIIFVHLGRLYIFEGIKTFFVYLFCGFFLGDGQAQMAEFGYQVHFIYSDGDV